MCRPRTLIWLSPRDLSDLSTAVELADLVEMSFVRDLPMFPIAQRVEPSR
jgi:hypothetical protein